MLLDVFSFVAVGEYVNDIPDSDFSAGEKQIFRMLSAFTSSGCSGQFPQAVIGLAFKYIQNFANDELIDIMDNVCLNVCVSGCLFICSSTILE